MSFVGQWNTLRYAADVAGPPEEIVLTITADADPLSLDGGYSRPGQDARMHGAIENGVMWRAVIDEAGSTNDRGEAIFFLSADQNTLHGAWRSDQHNNGAQPWYGTRL